MNVFAINVCIDCPPNPLAITSTPVSPTSGTSEPAAAGTSLDTVLGSKTLEAIAGNSAVSPVPAHVLRMLTGLVSLV